MTRGTAQAAGAALVVAAGLASWSASPPLAAAEEGVGACRAHIASLRYRIGGGDAADGAEHRLLGGLSSGEAGQPRENWFGEPPERALLLSKLDRAEARADAGRARACLALVQEVRAKLEEPGGAGG